MLKGNKLRLMLALGLSEAFLCCVSLGLLLYREFNPPDRVRVLVKRIPSGVDFLSIVAWNDGVMVNLDWSLTDEVLCPFTMPPGKCTVSRVYLPYHDVERDVERDVEWRPGQRYGVVTRSFDGGWRIAWFSAEQVPVRGKLWLLGGGNAKFDMAFRSGEPLDLELADRLGLPKDDPMQQAIGVPKR